LKTDGGAYLSLLWDGSRYTKYRRLKKDEPGQVLIDDFTLADPRIREGEINSLRYHNMLSSVMGYYGGRFERIDQILRGTSTIAVRQDMERVNESLCYVIQGGTEHGDYTAWIDPVCGYSVAKVCIEVSHPAGRGSRGRTVAETWFGRTTEVVRFDHADGVWVPKELVCEQETRAGGTSRKTRSRVKVVQFSLNPDHEALRSFAPDDIADGAEVTIIPVLHIRYIWKHGELVKYIDENVVARIDAVLGTMLSDANESSTEPSAKTTAVAAHGVARESARPRTRRPSEERVTQTAHIPRSHCGLYCLYSILRLLGQDLDYRDLVKPEYYGRPSGSSLADLSRAAHDYGLYAGVATRLSTRALAASPYWAILHVRPSLESTEYDHYQLSMGMENGKAKLFDPPQAPKLVELSELAPRWDGYALFVSPRPFDIDRLFSADRQRVLLYGMVGLLLLLSLHLGKRLWTSRLGVLPRRWSLGLTAVQGAMLGLAALVAGPLYQFTSDEGLLANASATASLQKAYRGTFIPRISKARVHQLLGRDRVFIDARLASDYERGHLEGAISLPVDANEALWRQRTAAMPKDSRIVLYCQSSRCKFAEHVGTKLINDGYKDLCIFRGGWMEWAGPKMEAPALEVAK
jgi:rhodanese-related sulfurtransferase